MPTMTKTTIITWSAEQVNTDPALKEPFAELVDAELYRLTTAGKTLGQGTGTILSDGSLEGRQQWIDQESAQAWLDFVLSSLKSIYGPEKSYQSGVIEDIV